MHWGGKKPCAGSLLQGGTVVQLSKKKDSGPEMKLDKEATLA